MKNEYNQYELRPNKQKSWKSRIVLLNDIEYRHMTWSTNKEIQHIEREVLL